MTTGRITKEVSPLNETITFRIDAQTKESILQLMAAMEVTASEFFRRKAMRIVSTINKNS